MFGGGAMYDAGENHLSVGMIVGAEVMVAKPDFQALGAQAQAGFLDTGDDLDRMAQREFRLSHEGTVFPRPAERAGTGGPHL